MPARKHLSGVGRGSSVGAAAYRAHGVGGDERATSERGPAAFRFFNTFVNSNIEN
jgi:hypothetical protein